MDAPKFNFSATEIATYVVCPEAWRLKRLGHSIRTQTTRSAEVKRLRAEWVTVSELAANLRRYAKIIYVILLVFVLVIFAADRTLSERLRKEMRRKLLQQHGEP